MPDILKWVACAMHAGCELVSLSAQAFLQPERLDASETWYCGRCKAHVRAEKKLDLWSAPELLVGAAVRF